MTHRGRVLIVEDDAELRTLFRIALAYEGFAVYEAPDGMVALRMIDREPFDLVVLDLGLPKVNGVLVRQEIGAHAHTRNTPIVVVTGQSGEHPDLDVACLLRKPVTPEQLVAQVRRCLAARSDAAT